jgi:diguanylate cyclase (GGDEF)-like protein
MGHWLPVTGRDLLPPKVRHAVRRSSPPSRTWLVGVAALTALYVPVLVAGSAASYRGLLWVIPPFIAALAWLHAGSHLWGRVRAAFWVMGAAAGVGAIAQLYAVYEASFFAGRGEALVLGVPGVWLALLCMPLLMGVGAVLTLAPLRGGVPGTTLLTDTLLLLLVGVVVASRLLVEPLLRAGAGPAELAVGVAQPAVILVPMLLACVVVLRRGSALAPRSAVLLLVAIALLATWSVVYRPPVAAQLVGPAGPALSLWPAAWLLFAFSALDSRTVASTPRGMVERRRVRDHLRILMVPGSALFLVGAILHIGLGTPPLPLTVVAVALLAAVLALRTVHAFQITDRDAEQRRQLAHTQALVAVTHSLAGTVDLDATLRVISESARTVLGTKGAGIELMTENGRSLETRAAVGMPEGLVGMRFPVEGSFTGWVVRHGEPRATLDATRDPYIQPQSLDFLGRWPVAAAPIQFRGETLGALFACIRTDPFEAEELHLLGAMAEQAAIAIQNARLFEQVTVLSITDPLTGLANRRQLERELARDFAAAQRGRVLTAVIFDLDDFKAYNDTFGHLAGDEGLQIFASALRAETRAMNLVARYGGDEFVALLSETDAAGAAVFVERVRRRFDLEISALGHGGLTISAGIATYSPDMDTAEDLLRRADAELYRTKPGVRT